MRGVLLFVLLVMCGGVLRAQTESPQGAYVCYKPVAKGKYVKQVLNLAGTSGGKYSLVETGGEQPDITNGYWMISKIWRHNRDSMNVVIMDYENEYEVHYLEIEPTGCLTPVDEDGYRRRGVNAFKPVWRLSYSEQKKLN